MKFSSIIPSLYIPTSITISMAIIALTPPPTSKNFAMLSWHINMQQTKITTHMIRWYHLILDPIWPCIFVQKFLSKMNPCHKVTIFGSPLSFSKMGLRIDGQPPHFSEFNSWVDFLFSFLVSRILYKTSLKKWSYFLYNDPSYCQFCLSYEFCLSLLSNLAANIFSLLFWGIARDQCIIKVIFLLFGMIKVNKKEFSLPKNLNNL